MTDVERYERGQEIVREVEREFAGRPMPEMVEEVRARVEKLMTVEGGSYCSYLMKPVAEEPLRAEPRPVQVSERAFPDSFYYKPTIVQEPDPPLIYSSPITQVWIAPTENFGKRSHADWGRSEPSVPGVFCMCGHPAEAHAPACVHLIEGCGCEGFLKMPQGSVEGA